MLIEKGYNNYLADQDKRFLADETRITAGLYDHIEAIINSETLPFEIVPEYPEYLYDIKKGGKNPKKAKRFDLLIVTWNTDNTKIKFGVEAKLLIETNTSTKNATFLTNEYVGDTGMGKFIKGIYGYDGFMLGYILNGETDQIIGRINLKITSTYSDKEQIGKSQRYYLSNYTLKGKNKELYHIFFDFATLVVA